MIAPKARRCRNETATRAYRARCSGASLIKRRVVTAFPLKKLFLSAIQHKVYVNRFLLHQINNLVTTLKNAFALQLLRQIPHTENWILAGVFSNCLHLMPKAGNNPPRCCGAHPRQKFGMGNQHFFRLTRKYHWGATAYPPQPPKPAFPFPRYLVCGSSLIARFSFRLRKQQALPQCTAGIDR